MVLTQRPTDIIFESVNQRFHTTMVLTQPTLFQDLLQPPDNVSIPLWFLRNLLKFITLLTLSIVFPYHYGSYATQRSRIASHTLLYVSIPLWFLRNTLPPLSSHSCISCFHTTMVLTQLSASSLNLLISAVSIPLWFLRNRFYYKDIIQVLGRQNQPIGKIS